MSEREEFSVWVFWPDESHFALARFIGAEHAVRMARLATRGWPARCIDASRIIITDGGDHTCFEWRRGEGVTFPPREVKQ
jgi:hypothetical protein